MSEMLQDVQMYRMRAVTAVMRMSDGYPVRMVPALQEGLCACDGLSVRPCVRPVCVAVATGHDEIRK